jgi:hypothetical protein
MKMQTQPVMTAEMSFTRLKRIEKSQRRLAFLPIAYAAALVTGIVACVAGLVM